MARNWHAVNAHLRKAGPMKHKNKPKGGTRNESREWQDELHKEVNPKQGPKRPR